jgi:hypothetical protein
MRVSPKPSRILSGSQTGEFIGFLRRRSQLISGSAKQAHSSLTPRRRDLRPTNSDTPSRRRVCPLPSAVLSFDSQTSLTLARLSLL